MLKQVFPSVCKFQVSPLALAGGALLQIAKENSMKRLTILLVFLLFGAALSADKVGVYEFVVQKCSQGFDEAAGALEEALREKFQLVGVVDEAAPENCQFRTRVFAVYSPEYAAQVVAANGLTGPFAVVDRINLFEDEDGVHVSIVNPRNILRTVLMDDVKYEQLASSRRQELREAILAAVSGQTSESSMVNSGAKDISAGPWA